MCVLLEQEDGQVHTPTKGAPQSSQAGLDVLVAKLSKYLTDDASPSLRSIAAEGFAKLFSARRLCNPKVRPRLSVFVPTLDRF